MGRQLGIREHSGAVFLRCALPILVGVTYWIIGRSGRGAERPSSARRGRSSRTDGAGSPNRKERMHERRGRATAADRLSGEPYPAAGAVRRYSRSMTKVRAEHVGAPAQLVLTHELFRAALSRSLYAREACRLTTAARRQLLHSRRFTKLSTLHPLAPGFSVPAGLLANPGLT